MARRKVAAAQVAATPTLPHDAPHWQVARLAEPGQVFTSTDIQGVTVTVVADARGVVIPASIAENTLVDRLPVAPLDILAAAISDAEPTDLTEDAGADAGQED